MDQLQLRSLVILGFVAISGIILGLVGISKSQNKSSTSYYKSFNILITGVMCLLFFVFFVIFNCYENNLKEFFNRKMFCLAGAIWCGLTMFIIGIHGVINRRIINNRAFNRICVSQLVTSFVYFIGIFVYIYIWGWK